MVLEDRQVDDGVAGSGEGGGEETADAAIDGEIGFVTGGIVADVADAILAGGDGETGGLESESRRSQTTMLARGMPACWRRSQTASTRTVLVELPRPERQLTFRPTTSVGRAMRFQAAMGESAS